MKVSNVDDLAAYVDQTGVSRFTRTAGGSLKQESLQVQRVGAHVVVSVVVSGEPSRLFRLSPADALHLGQLIDSSALMAAGYGGVAGVFGLPVDAASGPAAAGQSATQGAAD